MPAMAGTPKRGRRIALIASGLSIALVTGLAIAAAWVWNGWGQTQPEAVLPASVAAFGRLDLDPGLGARLALADLIEKFPKQEQDKDVTEQAVSDLISDLGLEPLTYEADIKPWFANKLGVAIWKHGASTDPCTLTAMASSADDKATTALSKVRERKGSGRFGFALRDGYAILAACDTGSQEAADAAAAEQPLTTNAEFTQALDSLARGQLAVGWADLSKAATLVAGDVARVGGVTMPTNTMRGYVIAGLRPTDQGIDLQLRVRGGAAPAAAQNATEALRGLPGGTALGVTLDLRELGRNLGAGQLFPTPTGAPSLPGTPDCLLTLDEDSTPEEIEACLGPLPPADPSDGPILVPGVPSLSEECLNAIEGTDPSPEEIQKCFVVGSTTDDECLAVLTKPNPDPDELERCFPGITGEGGGSIGPDPLRDPASLLTMFGPAIETLLRSSVTVAVTGIGGDLQVRATATTSSQSESEAVGELLNNLGFSGTYAQVSGTTVTVTTPGYKAGAGTLGDDARFAATLDGAPTNAVMAFYVDIEKATADQKLTAKEAANVKPLKAVGGAVGYEGTDTVALIRILIT
jgi:hypothetical protein